MKPQFFEDFQRVFDLYLPQKICEIGTHNGASACQFVDYLVTRVPQLYYTGYDMFDQAQSDLDRIEGNGKGAGSYDVAYQRLDSRRQQHSNFDFELVVGNTRESFTVPQRFDFVYIDGGHSYTTVMHDYSMVRGSRVIVFDDLNLSGVEMAVKEIQSQESDYEFLEWKYPQFLKRRKMAMFFRGAWR